MERALMEAAVNSQDQPIVDIAARNNADAFSIQKNDRLQHQWELGRSAEQFVQLKESTRIQDQRFFDPVADFVQPSAVYLIPTS
jgi:hypothetical protein